MLPRADSTGFFLSLKYCKMYILLFNCEKTKEFPGEYSLTRINNRVWYK